MPDTPEKSEVRIAVQRPSAESDDDSYLRSGPSIKKPDSLVIVPVTETLLDAKTGLNVERFLRTAVALAADNDGRVLLLGIGTVSDEAALETLRECVDSDQSIDDADEDVVTGIGERRRQLAEMADVAQELDPSVPVRAVVRTVTDLTEGVLDVLEGGSEVAVLLLRGTGLDESRLLSRSTIDAILTDAECDVFIENMATEGGANALYVPDVEEHTVASLAESEAGSIDSILLPVGMGPHSALAAEAARAVARAADASVTVLHVISPGESSVATAEAKDLLKFADYVLGSEVETETELKEASDTTDVILEEAEAHDFVSIGAPTQKSRLERLVFEPVQQTVSEQSEATVLMSRDSNRTMRSLYYRWKRGIESIEDGS